MKKMLLTIVFLLFCIGTNEVIAKDNLFLTGRLEILNKDFAVIYVISENCRGERKFQIDDETYKIINKNKDKYSVRIYFAIDSDVCHKRKTDKITEVEE